MDRWRLAGRCHEHELIELAGLGEVLDDIEVASLLGRGFRGLAKPREHWYAPVGDRRTRDRLTDGQWAFNRLQAGLHALVEQSSAHLAGAWALRRWRGLLYRVRDVFRATGALICLGRWAAPDPHMTAASRPVVAAARRGGGPARRPSRPLLDRLMGLAVASKRAQLYQEFQRELNQSSPFFPVFQPAQVLAAAKSLTNLQYNPTWTVDIADIGAQ